MKCCAGRPSLREAIDSIATIQDWTDEQRAVALEVAARHPDAQDWIGLAERVQEVAVESAGELAQHGSLGKTASGP